MLPDTKKSANQLKKLSSHNFFSLDGETTSNVPSFPQFLEKLGCAGSQKKTSQMQLPHLSSDFFFCSADDVIIKERPTSVHGKAFELIF